MKHSYLLNIVISIVVLGFVSCATGAKKGSGADCSWIIGTWEGKDGTGKTGIFDFTSDNKITLIIDDQRMGGPDLLRYSINCAKKPVELEILGIDAEGKQRGKISMIVNMISKDRIKIKTYFNDSTPLGFDNETSENTITLDRKPD